MGLEKLERGTLEKIAESSPELQELYLKKFQEIEDKINKKEADWGDFESLLYEAITHSEEGVEIVTKFLKQRMEKRAKETRGGKKLIIDEHTLDVIPEDVFKHREN